MVTSKYSSDNEPNFNISYLVTLLDIICNLFYINFNVKFYTIQPFYCKWYYLIKYLSKQDLSGNPTIKSLSINWENFETCSSSSIFYQLSAAFRKVKNPPIFNSRFSQQSSFSINSGSPKEQKV